MRMTQTLLGRRSSTALHREAPASRRVPQPISRLVGAGLVAVGVLLLAAAGVYYGYVTYASRNLDRLVYKPAPEDQANLDGLSEFSRSGDGLPPGGRGLYPGDQLPARAWADPRSTQDLGQDALADGFIPMSSGATGPHATADRIRIPAISVDSRVEELSIIDLGDSRAYETPKFVVGHIPTTSYPGARGNGWYFGHLESPIQDEGNVFARLPKIPGLLRSGEDVFVVIKGGEKEYLYQVTETDLLHDHELALTRSDDARITLVTCYPRLKYDQRLLVTAKLVGYRDVAPEPIG